MARQLGHVHLKVRDAARAKRFYTDVFGLSVTEEVGQYTFLSFGEHHHDIALQEVDPGTETDRRSGGSVDEADVDAIFHDDGSDTAIERGDTDGAGDATGVGLYHAAFEVDDEASLGELYQQLRGLGVETKSVDHGISKALYFEDPSGNGLEAYVDTRTGDDELWEGENDRFDPTKL